MPPFRTINHKLLHHPIMSQIIGTFSIIQLKENIAVTFNHALTINFHVKSINPNNPQQWLVSKKLPIVIAWVAKSPLAKEILLTMICNLAVK